MKKYFGLILLSSATLLFSVFISSYSKEEPLINDEFEHADVSDFLWENVYPKLDVLTENSFNKSFSRCPSGFSQSLDEEQSGNTFAYGIIYNSEGCAQTTFCAYKVNMIKKTVALKNLEEKEYLAMDDYIEIELDKKVAKI